MVHVSDTGLPHGGRRYVRSWRKAPASTIVDDHDHPGVAYPRHDSGHVDALHGVTVFRGQPCREVGDEHVLADVQVPRPTGSSRTRAAGAVAAPIPRPAVHPVRIQPSTTQCTPQQPGQDVPSAATVLRRPRRPDGLRSDEVRFTHQGRVSHAGRDRPLRGRATHVARAGRAMGGLPVPHLPAGIARIAQDHRYRAQRPRAATAMPVPARIHVRRTRDPALGELAGDARHAPALPTPREHPPHVRCRRRIRVETLQSPPPLRVRPIRVRPAVHQPVSVRRPPAQVSALLAHLGLHSGHDPVTRPQHLAPRLRTENCQQRPVFGRLRVDRAAGLRQHTVTALSASVAATVVNCSCEANARSYSPTTTALNAAVRASASSAAARGRRGHGDRRAQPTSKNSPTMTPRPAISDSAISRCQPRDDHRS